VHPNGLSTIDWINLATVVAIFLANLVILNLLSRKAAAFPGVRHVSVAHGFWTGAWLMWFFAWIAHFETLNLLVPDLLDDVGAFFLIAFAVTLVGGLMKLRTHWFMIAAFFVIDVMWLGTASAVMPACVRVMAVRSFEEWVAGPNGMSAADMIFHRTVIFAPSLCLVILALGLVAWSFIAQSGGSRMSGLLALLIAGYALLNVAFFQVSFFVPALEGHADLEYFFLAWRVVLVFVYSILTLGSVGIRIPFQHVLATVGTAGALVSTILGLLRRH